MASRARLDWRGEQVVANYRNAARRAVNEIVDEAADDARFTHEWKNTPTRFSKAGGQLESEIDTKHATQKQRNPLARFGFTRRRGFVGLFQEEGTVHQRVYLALHPAADRHFTKDNLTQRIRRRLR